MWGKRHVCPRMSLNPLVVLFPSPVLYKYSSCSGHRQPSSFPEGASCPPEVALLLVALCCICASDISALVRGLRNRLCRKGSVWDQGCWPTFEISGRRGPQQNLSPAGVGKIPRVGLGGAARCQSCRSLKSSRTVARYKEID